ncbi:MAG: HNH endonuclease signature motif containing protein, partial [Actinomycetes bacterium]
GLAGWLKRADRPHPGTDGFADDRPTDRRRGDAIAELFTANAATPDQADPDGQDDQDGQDGQGEGEQGAGGQEPEGAEGADDPARLWTKDADAPSDAQHDGPDGTVVCPPSNVAITVSIALAELHARLGQVGLLGTGGTLTPTQLRRLACDAAMIPAVLGGPGQILDLGRATRDWTLPQRRAVTLRDQGCAAPGCDRPPAACQIHHRDHWEDGGPTDLCNACLLCTFHHQQVHRQGWRVVLAANGYPAFIPPASIDPERRPRQHHRYRLELLTTRRRN